MTTLKSQDLHALGTRRVETILEGLLQAAQFHPAWDRCSQGVRKLHGRNMHIILGADLQTPVSFVVCWTVDGAIIGGTGVALRCAMQHNIPVFNLALPGHLDAARGSLS